MIWLLLAVLAIAAVTGWALRREFSRPRPTGSVTVTLSADVSAFIEGMRRAGLAMQAFTVTRPIKAGEEMVVGDNVEPIDYDPTGYRDAQALARVFDRDQAARLRVFIRQQPWPERPRAAHICAELGKAGLTAAQITGDLDLDGGYHAVRHVRRHTGLSVEDAAQAVASVVTLAVCEPYTAGYLVPLIRNLGGTR